MATSASRTFIFSREPVSVSLLTPATWATCCILPRASPLTPSRSARSCVASEASIVPLTQLTIPFTLKPTPSAAPIPRTVERKESTWREADFSPFENWLVSVLRPIFSQPSVAMG